MMPSYSVSFEKILLPDCTYHLLVNVSVGYDPIVLDQVDYLIIHAAKGLMSHGDQSFPMPFNNVSACGVLLYK